LGVVVVQRRTGLVAAALSGVLAGTGTGTVYGAAPARAAEAPVSEASVGSISTTIDGVPAQVTVGDSFSPLFTIHSTSGYRIEVQDFYFSITNDAAQDTNAGVGIDVQWKDPATGIWRTSSSEPDGGVWALSEPAHTVWIAPHGSLTIRLFITMNGAATRGPDALATTGISAYSLFNSAGVNVPGLLGYNHAQAAFYFGAPSNGTGSGSSVPTGNASSSAVPPGAGQGAGGDGDGDGDADGGTGAGAATSQPTTTSTASPDQLYATSTPPTDAPGSQESTAAIAATPVGSPAEAASTHNTGFTTYATPLAVLVLLGVAAFAGGIVLTRRGRGNP
jgi:hypothetical protein